MKRIIIALLKPLSFLPAICIMYMIYSFSAQTGDQSSQLSYQVSRIIVQTGAEILDKDLTEDEINYYIEKYHYYIRKLAHMTEYCILAISIAIPLYTYGLRGFWLVLFAGFICCGFAASDEYHQSMVGGRTPSKKDVLIDSVGVFIGIYITRILGWTFFTHGSRRRKRKSGPSGRQNNKRH